MVEDFRENAIFLSELGNGAEYAILVRGYKTTRKTTKK